MQLILSDFEIGIIKTMLTTKKYSKQDILSYFTRPNRTVNHRVISEIESGKRFPHIKQCSENELKYFIRKWPNIDKNTGLSLVDDHFLIKAREFMILSVRTYNSSGINFKSDLFIVHSIMAWTYLFQAFFLKKNLPISDSRKKKDSQNIKYLGISNFINMKESEIDSATKSNLELLIKIRNEFVHQLAQDLDEYIIYHLQANCINFNKFIMNKFNKNLNLENELSLSLHFSKPTINQIIDKNDNSLSIPNGAEVFIRNFEDQLEKSVLKDKNFKMKINLEMSNIDGESLSVNIIDSNESGKIHAITIEKDGDRHTPKSIVAKMHELGFVNFSLYLHTKLVKDYSARNNPKYSKKGDYNNFVYNNAWLDLVKKHCEENSENYSLTDTPKAP